MDSWRGYRVDRWRFRAPAPAPVQPVSRRDKTRFAANAVLFDWLSLLPAQIWVEPTFADTGRSRRCLRVCRTPFLLILLAPAVLPGLFSSVPRAAPTSLAGGAGWAMGDVSRSFLAWFLGVSTWWAGILLGLAIIKVLLRLSEPPFAPDPAVVDHPLRPDHGLATCHEAGCPGAGCLYGGAQPTGERPFLCSGRYELRQSIAMFFGLVLRTYVAMGNFPFLYEDWVSPAVAICAALGILAMFYTFIALQLRPWHLPMILGLAVYLV
jgi:hypothetical protein